MKFMLIAWFVVASLLFALKFIGAATELDPIEKVLGVDPEKHMPLTIVCICWSISIIVAMVATLRFLILL